MNNLVWQSVMWRPGTGRFLISVKNPYLLGRPRPPANATLPGPRRSPDSQRQSGYDLPPSRIRRHFLIQIDAPLRIAAPGMLLEAEPLPHLICSRPIFIGGVKNEADQHDDA